MKKILLCLVCAAFSTVLAKDPEVPEPRVELEKDRVPKTHTGGSVLLAGGTVLPVTGPRLVADVLVLNGKIKAIGKDLDAPEGVARIDCKGRFVAPGAIDCHSHIAITNGINEMIEKISSEVRIKDVINPKDVAIYRTLAGGTTCNRILHGSGNPIGGQDAIIKLKFGLPAKDLILWDAPQGIKFALGENPTRQDAFPRTRMGMATTYRRAFTEGREYADGWRKYRAAKERGEDPPPPRKDLRLEALAGILDGSIKIHCHCYRADEMTAFLDVCDEFGVKVATLQHCLEAYKIADRIEKHGAGVSTFSDWWAYTIELGKDGDLVVWNGHPLSAYSHPILSLVDGEVYFERPEGPRPREGAHGLPDPATFQLAAGPDARPVAPPTGSIFAIVGARIEPVSTPAIERGTIIIKDGKIARLGRDVPVPDSATVIDGAGLTVTPGFIDAGSWLGLVEIDQLRVTRDDRDSGDFQPDLVALTAIFPASEHIPVTRAGGITTTLATPTGGLVAGQASVIHLSGVTAKEMNVLSPFGLVVDFPSRPGPPPEGGPQPRRHDRLEALEKLFDNAKAELERRDRPADTRLDAMAPYLRGEKPVLFRADSARTILDALAFAEARKLRPIILSGREAWKVANVLAARKVPVLFGPVLDLPDHEWDPYDAPYAAAGVLADAGVQVAIRSGGSALAGPRNLPFEAAMAASYGLGRERALAAITKVPAEILGLEGRGVL